MSPEGHDPSASGSLVGPDPMLGQVLDGRYRVIEKLGEGGMGEVYAAEHVHIEKRVAVKLLRAEIVSNKEAVSRFRQEARSASSIGHKNIIAIEDFGTIADGRIYLCMELLEGAAFNDMISGSQLPMDRLLNILIQTGHGLAAAHAKDIVHRDMKPENIFVTTGDVPKLLDFGIAKVSGADGQNHLTRTGTIFGTPFYMAPEQALGQAVDHRADIYAMGVIMYEVFTGSIPFQGESFMGILTQHITAEPKPVAVMAAEHGRQVAPALDEIIVRAMKKDPEERYQTMDELVNALISVYRGTTGSGMSAYMEAHVPSSAMMATVAAPIGALPGHPSASIPASHPPAPTPMPRHEGSSPTPMPGGYANVPGRAPSQPNHPAGYHSPSSSVYDIPKKSKAGLIVALLLIVGITAGGVLFYLFGMEKDEKTTATPDASVVAKATPDAALTAAGSDAGAAVTIASRDAAPTAAVDAGRVAVAADAAPTVEPQKITITARPSGTVYLGRKKIGKTPVKVDWLPGTKASYTIRRRGYRSASVTVDGKKKKESVSLSKIVIDPGPGPDIPDPPADPCKVNKNSVACACKKPSALKCKCKKNPSDPACALE